jgi:hypothetical protein
MTVTTGWGQGHRARFLGFADGEGGLAFQNVGPSTTVITALPRKGDAIVEIDNQQYACWFRNLDPFPARIVIVHEDLCSCDHLDEVDALGCGPRRTPSAIRRSLGLLVTQGWPTPNCS